MGYRSLAMSTSERTHQIPVEKFERAESDYRMVLADLERFVSDGSRGDLPPVFAKVDCSVVVSPLHRALLSHYILEESLIISSHMTTCLWSME